MSVGRLVGWSVGWSVGPCATSFNSIYNVQNSTQSILRELYSVRKYFFGSDPKFLTNMIKHVLAAIAALYVTMSVRRWVSRLDSRSVGP